MVGDFTFSFVREGGFFFSSIVGSGEGKEGFVKVKAKGGWGVKVKTEVRLKMNTKMKTKMKMKIKMKIKMIDELSTN